MSKPSINDPKLAQKFGYKNAFEFWANYSGQSTGTLVDHAQYTLTKCGYTGTLDDKFNAFLKDMFGTTTPRTPMDSFNSLSDYPLSGLTFFKNYANLPTGTVTSTQLNANLSKGSATAIFTATRSATAPATYVDDNGVIQLTTTSNVGRISGGYYDATGFHAQKGLMIEGSSTNYVTNSLFAGDDNADGLANGWTSSGINSASAPSLALVDIKNIINCGSVCNAQRVYTTETTAAGTGARYIAVSASQTGFAQGDVVTISSLVKGTLTNCNFSLGIYEYNNTTYKTQVYSSSLTSSISSSEYRLVSATLTVSGDDTNAIRPYFRINDLASGDSYDITVARFQCEKSANHTSFIPTTTAALTRGAETLKYAIAGNRTAASESIFVKFSPMGSFANDGVARNLLDSDTKVRGIYKASSSASISVYPNQTDSPSCITSLATWASGTSYVVGAMLQHSSPYINIYKDGTSGATETADDFTNPAWGTYFYIGSNSSGANQGNCIFQSLSFFSDAKSETDVASITNLLNQ